MIMTLEERLNEIVEKQLGDAIIPFLQGLTQEERKSLVPRLNKLEEYYSKFVQLNLRTHTVHGGLPHSLVSSILPLSSLFAERIP